MARKRALITGITGQDGALLAELLLSKEYEVHGIKRRSSSFNIARLDHMYTDPHVSDRRLFLSHGDLTDMGSTLAVMRAAQPDEVYNLGGQSHVAVSFELPEYTAQVNALGTLRLLEAIRLLGRQDQVRFFQAGTSEMYGLAQTDPQNEQTPFAPRSPYASAKLYAHWTTSTYREAYGIFAVNGILFNHESPLRGETFVTRKITRAAARISLGIEDALWLGNLDGKRDWGHARDTVRAMYLMLQQDQPRDLVIATGQQHTVRELCTLAFAAVGLPLTWHGSGTEEVARHAERVLVRVDPRYFRPAEVPALRGDARLARQLLGWKPTIDFAGLVAEMVAADLERERP